jgi:hypothetical protein
MSLLLSSTSTMVVFFTELALAVSCYDCIFFWVYNTGNITVFSFLIREADWFLAETFPTEFLGLVAAGSFELF